MRALGGFCVALLCAGGLYAQHHSGGGGFSRPASNSLHGTGSSHHYSGRPAYGYPVYVYPGFIGTSYLPFGYDYTDYAYGFSGYGDQQAPAQQQPNTTVVYPPQPTTANPVIINIGTPGQGGAAQSPAPPESSYRSPEPQESQEEAAAEATHYLIALKDHTIYSAVAYWVDGSTLHYFTSGNTHNQISVSLVDRELTERLNKGTGLEVQLPPAK